jgi:hypothetical protein
LACSASSNFLASMRANTALAAASSCPLQSSHRCGSCRAAAVAAVAAALAAASAISPTSVQRTEPLYQAVLADAKFHEQLLVFDRDLSATARAVGCHHLCGGTLHSAPFARKPPGGPAGLGQDYAQRFSFCCSADGCRKRTTPPSLRFLGRKVYLATVVTLISAMLHGTTPARLTRLSIVPGIDRRTLARWRVWWRSTFSVGSFALVAKATFMPQLDIASLPASLLDRFAGDNSEQLIADHRQRFAEVSLRVPGIMPQRTNISRCRWRCDNTSSFTMVRPPR